MLAVLQKVVNYLHSDEGYGLRYLFFCIAYATGTTLFFYGCYVVGKVIMVALGD